MKQTIEYQGMLVEVEAYKGSGSPDDPSEIDVLSAKIVNTHAFYDWQGGKPKWLKLVDRLQHDDEFLELCQKELSQLAMRGP
jgi:hypothetical protein